MARLLFSLPPAGAAAVLKPGVHPPAAATATGAEIQRFLSVIQHGKSPSAPDISPPHPVRPQKDAMPPRPETGVPQYRLLPAGEAGEKGDASPKQPVFRGCTADNKTDGNRRIPGETDAVPADNIPHSSTEIITAHLQLRKGDLITGIGDTLLSRIRHITGKNGTLSTCRATFPALGEVSFTVSHSADGVHIQIRCPSAGQALLLSCLPRLQERLSQKTPLPVTISLTGHTTGSAVRRK